MDLEKTGHKFQCVSFRLGHTLFGVDILDIREIISCAKMTQVQQAPKFVLGLINLRGQVLTIFDISVLLGLDHHRVHSDSHIIIFKHKPVGFVVDQVGDVIDIDPKDRTSVPANIEPGIQTYMEHIIRLPEDILMILAAPKILSGAHTLDPPGESI